MTIASLTGAACSRGVYFIANDAVIDIAIAFLNSFRRHNAAMPLCMIPFNESIQRLQLVRERFNFEIWQDHDLLARCDDISRQFHGTVRGHYRKLVLWEGPFEEFLYLDTDTVILEDVAPVFRYLSAHGFITSHSNMPHIRKWVWKDSVVEVERLSPEQIAFAANTGFICSRRGILPLDEVSGKLASALELVPHMELSSLEQPLLNYLIVTSGREFNSLYRIFCRDRSTEIALERWGGIDLGETVDGYFVHPHNPHTLLVHWAGEWRRAEAAGEPIRNRELWEFYRHYDQSSARDGGIEQL
jgi:hypothetical protein